METVWKIDFFRYIEKGKNHKMKNLVFIIMKKELYRFFGDKRLVFSTLIMPFIMMVVMYQVIGFGMNSMTKVDENYIVQAVSINTPLFMERWSEKYNINLEQMNGVSVKYKQKMKILENKKDIIIYFPESFEEKASNYDIKLGKKAPEIKIYYSSAIKESLVAYEKIKYLLEEYESTISNKFDINVSKEEFDLGSTKDVVGNMLSGIIPLFIIMFLFSSCSSIAADCIVGEKENGTLATILVTPIRRKNIAIGKILSTSIVAILSGLSSVMGIIVSFFYLFIRENNTILMSDSVMYNQQTEKMQDIVNLGEGIVGYRVKDGVLVLVLMLVTVLFMVSMIAIISTLAKTVKEAHTYIMPLHIVTMVLGITGMLGEKADIGVIGVLIPIYNSVQSLKQIFSFKINLLYMVMTIVINLIYSLIFVTLIAKTFESERIIYTQ